MVAPGMGAKKGEVPQGQAGKAQDSGLAIKNRGRSARSQRWRALRLGIAKIMAPALLSVSLRALERTLRLEVVGGGELLDRWARGERVIVSFWHNRLVVMPMLAPGEPLCVMVSEHRDGEIALRAVRRLNIRAVRGSATRGGVKSLRQLIRAYHEGFNLVIVPDGPRGPCYEVKLGIIQLARATGATIVPISWASSRGTRLRSWDRLIIPLPFSRVALVVGDFLTVPRDGDRDQLEQCRKILEKRLNELNRAAENHLVS